MSSLLVLQSQHPAFLTGWMQHCVDSVCHWAGQYNFDYQITGDEIFGLLPVAFRKKFASRGPILSDLARLLAIRDAFDNGYQHVVWADADLLVFDPDGLSVQGWQFTDCGFGLETWIDLDKNKRIRHWYNLHNAFMIFHKNSVVLPYLIFSIESIAGRIDPSSVAPQTFGPKLLSALNSISGFDRIDRAGAFSPAVLNDITAGGGPYLDRLRAAQPAVPSAANLCASLATDNAQMDKVCERLLREGFTGA